MDLRLSDKVAFVSGSTASIGFAIAKRLLIEGAQVIINGRTQTTIDETILQLKSLCEDGYVLLYIFENNKCTLTKVDYRIH